MREAAPLHPGEAGGAGLGGELVDAHRIDGEGRATVIGGDGERDGNAQVGGVLPARAAQQLGRHLRRGPQRARRHRPEQPAPPHHRREARAGGDPAEERPHRLEPHGKLVGHAGGPERLRGMSQALLGDRGLAPEEAELGGARPGIHREYQWTVRAHAPSSADSAPSAIDRSLSSARSTRDGMSTGARAPSMTWATGFPASQEKALPRMFPASMDGHEQDVGPSRQRVLDALRLGGPGEQRVVERERPDHVAAFDLPALGHLHERPGVERVGHGRGGGLHRAEDRHHRLREAEPVEDPDRVLEDGHLLGQAGSHVHAAVGDPHDAPGRGGGVLADHHVGEDAPGAQAVVAVQHGPEQVARGQASLEQHGGLAGPDPFHRERSGPPVVRLVDDLVVGGVLLQLPEPVHQPFPIAEEEPAGDPAPARLHHRLQRGLALGRGNGDHPRAQGAGAGDELVEGVDGIHGLRHPGPIFPRSSWTAFRKLK